MLELITKLSTGLWDSMLDTIINLGASIPKVIIALVVLLFGWLVSKFIGRTIDKLFKSFKTNEFAEKYHVNDYLKKANLKMTLSELIGKFFFWVVFLLFIIAIADSFQWHRVSDEISKVISYLPKVFIAIAFFLVGAFVSSFIRDLIRGAFESLGISSGRSLSNLIFYFCLTVVTLTALGQAGFDTSILTLTLTLILGAILVTAAISYGFASREVLTNILASFFSKQNFKKGMVIEIDGIKGEIIDSNNVSLKLKLDNDEYMIIPTRKLIEENIKIFPN